MTDHNREEVAKMLDELGVTVVYADDPVDGSQIEVVHLSDLVKIRHVFELAHTPTSDDWGALTLIVRDVHNYDGRAEWLSLSGADAGRIAAAAIAAGFRRTVQGEPMRGTFGHVWPCPLFYVGNWGKENQPLRECVGGYCATEPQGEPTTEHECEFECASDEEHLRLAYDAMRKEYDEYRQWVQIAFTHNIAKADAKKIASRYVWHMTPSGGGLRNSEKAMQAALSEYIKMRVEAAHAALRAAYEEGKKR